MHRIFFSITFFILLLPAFGQTNASSKFLTIREAMDIVAYRRYHPLMNDDELDRFLRPIIKKYGYREEGFLEGIGTCSFWSLIKDGHVMQNPGPEDHDLFVPDNLQGASTVLVADCEGIETIEYDETAVSVEISVYTESNYNKIIKEMLDMGYTYKRRYPNDCQEYVYNSYTICIHNDIIRGNHYWNFTVRLNPRDFGSTKRYEYADSSRIHNLKIQVDYPIKGSPVLLRRIRTFIMEALELDLLNGWPMARYSSDVSNGQAVVNYYGHNSVASLIEKHNGQSYPFKEETKIRRVAENDYYVSYEVYRHGWYGGVDYYKNYGATFRKSDGKRLHVFANPEDFQFKQFMNNHLIFEKKDEIMDKYKNNIPMPRHEPFLIQSGVRFIYQQCEISAGAAGVIVEDASFSTIKAFLSEETKDVLKGFDDFSTTNMSVKPSNVKIKRSSRTDNKVANKENIFDVVEEMPQFPGGQEALLEYLAKNVKYPVVAEENGVQGRVILTFIVERDGSITNIKVVKSVDPSLDKEAIRVVKSMPRWVPGKQNGSPVRVEYSVPIVFRLTEPKENTTVVM